MDLASLGSGSSWSSLSAVSSTSTATSPSLPTQEDEQLYDLGMAGDGDLCSFCMSDIRGDVFMFQDKCYCSNLCRGYAVSQSDLYQAASPHRSSKSGLVNNSLLRRGADFDVLQYVKKRSPGSSLSIQSSSERNRKRSKRIHVSKQQRTGKWI